jgi:hypothetical protein
MGMLVGALIQIHDEQGRAAVHRSLRPLGMLAPGVYTFLVVLLAATFFGALLSWLTSLGWTVIGHGGDPSMVSVAEGVYFFAWHLLRSIPVLEIPDSFGWENPIQYNRSVLIGLLVVLYKRRCSFQSSLTRRTTGSIGATPTHPSPKTEANRIAARVHRTASFPARIPPSMGAVALVILSQLPEHAGGAPRSATSTMAAMRAAGIGDGLPA